jgi:hypothetical protein
MLVIMPSIACFSDSESTLQLMQSSSNIRIGKTWIPSRPVIYVLPQKKKTMPGVS